MFGGREPVGKACNLETLFPTVRELHAHPVLVSAETLVQAIPKDQDGVRGRCAALQWRCLLWNFQNSEGWGQGRVSRLLSSLSFLPVRRPFLCLAGARGAQ